MKRKSLQISVSGLGTIVSLLISVVVFAQTSRDVKPTETAMSSEGKTRALIIGISKYEYIDSLEYADRDAQVFAEYLHNNTFWHIASDDITLLVNDKAKNGDLITQLAKIARASKPGDNVLFYFSGHGDVETLTQFNNGYLLAYDTYTNNYIAGALPISFLKELFVTLLNKGVKVMLVTDACRSGKLAGGMKGAEFAASAISDMWKNEIKILSSQPGQLSFESPKWGSGRGVFSYYLVKGLLGEADANKDSSITLAELEMYVGNNVSRETGNRQQPIFEGPNKYSTVLARVFPPSQPTNLKPGGSVYTRPERVYYVPEDSCEKYYKEMNKAIDEDRFDESDPLSASRQYERLKACTNDSSVILDANSDLLAALMNETQEVANNSFIGQKLTNDSDFARGRRLVKQAIKYNDLQLPYDHHLNNLDRYFLVMESTSSTGSKDPKKLDQLGKIIDSALAEEPDAAYLLSAKSRLEMKRNNWQGAIELQKQSEAKSPGWLTPKYYMGISYGNLAEYQNAMSAFEEVLEKDSTHQTVGCTTCAFKDMSEWAKKLNMDKKSSEYFLKSLNYVPGVPDTPDPFEQQFRNGVFVMDSSGHKVWKDKGIENSFKNIKKMVDKQIAGIPLPPGMLDSLMKESDDPDDKASLDYVLSVQKYGQGKKDSAIYFMKRAVKEDPDEMYYMQTLLDDLQELNREDEIQAVIPANMSHYQDEELAQLKMTLAASYLKTKKQKEALKIYKDLIHDGTISCKDLDDMREVFSSMPEYIEFMKTCKDNVTEPTPPSTPRKKG